MNWIAVEESGGMTRWINLDNVTEVRSVSEAQITVRIYTTGVRSETQPHTITLQGETAARFLEVLAARTGE